MRNPEPRPGFPVIFRFLPVLALLIAALGLLAAAQAHAQQIPNNPRDVKVAVGDAKLTLTWQAPSSWGSGTPLGYEIDWSVGASAPALRSNDWQRVSERQYEVDSTATSYTFSGNVYDYTNGRHGHHTVANGNKYHLRFRAVSRDPNDNSNTLPGNWVTVSGTPLGAPTFGFEKATYLVKENVGSFVLAVQASSNVAADTTITISARDGTSTPSDPAAERGTDYGGAATRTVTMKAGKDRVEFTQVILDDNAVEPAEEKFTLTVTGVSSGAVGTPASTEITIGDQDVTVQFASAAYEVAENNSSARTVVLTATGDLSSDFTVGLRYTGYGTKEADEVQGNPRNNCADNADWDHLAIPASVTFHTNQARVEVPVTACNNADYVDHDESFTLSIEIGSPHDARVTPGARASTRVTIRDKDHSHGLSPGMPVLTPVKTGARAPTATTLSFSIACVWPGDAPVTNYLLEAEDRTSGTVVRHSHTVAWPCATEKVTVPGLESGTTYRVRAWARNLFARRSPLSDWVELSTTGTRQSGGGVNSGQTDRPPVAVHRWTLLIAKMKEWRNDPQWRMYRSHTSRWDRALKAFGEPVSDASLTAMTAAEAQALSDSGLTRWTEVARALREIEGGGKETPVPAVTIAAGSAVTEGALAVFTLTAAPAPASDLAVTVTVGQEGAFVHSSALGAHTVTIPAGGTSETLELLTMDDTTDEPDGSVTATLGINTGYVVGDAASAKVAVADDDEPLPAILTKRAIAREGANDAVVFTVRLDRPASRTVTVDYATADGAGRWASTAPARAGADYTATSGTLAFAAGETSKTVSVPILDDAIDEGMEHFLLRFSNPQGATLAARYRETQGLIRNDDHLQSTWLSRFGRTAGSQVADAVSERLSGGLSPGAHATLAGRPLDLAGAEDGTVLTDAMTALALALGAREAPPEGAEGPLARHDAEGPSLRNAPAATIAARSATGREILRGSSFHVSRGAGLSAWGRVAHGRFDGVQADGTGRTRLDGEVTTGILGVDAEWKRLLAGVAVSLSEGEGRFESPGADVGASGDVESTMTTVSPYARVSLSGRVTAWGLAGRGTGGMTLRFDDGSMAPVRTDLSMRLGAIGARGALLEQDASGGMDLALKADALFVRTESEAVANSVATGTDASRVRLVLEAGRAFGMGGGATLRPSLELGLRRDGGDAETGTGVEIGGGLAWSDPSSRVTAALRARALAAHAASGYGEWGVSGTLRIEPDRRGRGLSLSLASGVGAEAGGADAVWSARNAAALVPGAASDPSARLDAEVGYGLPAVGRRFTGTPYAGLSATDAEQGARVGWRLTRPADPEAFRLDVEAGRRETSGGGGPGNGIGFRITSRW